MSLKYRGGRNAAIHFYIGYAEPLGTVVYQRIRILSYVVLIHSIYLALRAIELLGWLIQVFYLVFNDMTVERQPRNQTTSTLPLDRDSTQL